MSRKKNVIQTYGRHRNRVITADLWSAAEDRKKHVFSFSNDSISSIGSDLSLNNISSNKPVRNQCKKNTKSSVGDKENIHKSNRNTRCTKKKSKEILTVSSASSLSESNNTGTSADLFGSYNTRGRSLRIDSSEDERLPLKPKNKTGGRNTKPAKQKAPKKKTKTTRNTRNKKIEEEISDIETSRNSELMFNKELSRFNFSEFDKYSLVVSDSPCNESGHEQLLHESNSSLLHVHCKTPGLDVHSSTPNIVTKGKRLTRSTTDVETSTPHCATKTTPKDGIKQSDISLIETLELSPELSPSNTDAAKRNESEQHSIHIIDSHCNSCQNSECENKESRNSELQDEIKDCAVMLDRINLSQHFINDRRRHNASTGSTSQKTLDSIAEMSYDASADLFSDMSLHDPGLTVNENECDEDGEDADENADEDDADETNSENEDSQEDSEDSDDEDDSGSDEDESVDLSNIQEEDESDEDAEAIEDPEANETRYMLNVSENISSLSIDDTNLLGIHGDGVANRSGRNISKAFRELDVSLHRSLKEILTPSKTQGPVICARTRLLEQCEQDSFISFSSCIPSSIMRKCVKIGEGVYGEVFRTETSQKQSVALKIIPIEGDFPVNDEQQKTFEEILPEIVISRELSMLRYNDENCTENFVCVNGVSCVQGKYPTPLLKQWDIYDQAKQSENDRPDMFDNRQLFIVFEFEDCGCALENYKFTSVLEAKSVLSQVTCALAVAECAMEFEHRDLHWGNVLVKQVEDSVVQYKLKGEEREMPIHGVKVSIIDFTLSRLMKDHCAVFTDLSTDDTLFQGEGDYQFDIYRAMKEENGNNWKPFNPHTNVLWVHYLADKLVHETKYRGQAKQNQVLLKELRTVLKEILKYQSATDLLNNCSFFNST